MKPSVVEARPAERKLSSSQKVAKARELRGQSKGLLFDRLCLLREAWNDREFVAKLGTMDDAIDAFDVEVEDVFVNWLELLGMLEMFGQRKQWIESDLQDLRAKREIAERERRQKEREANGEPKIVRPRATVQELTEAREETELVKQDMQKVINRAETQSQQIERLLVENSELKLENAKLLGRITELERQLSGSRVGT